MNLVDRLRNAVRWRLRARQLSSFGAELRRQHLQSPFVVIVMPGSLHVARLALQKLPGGIDRLIVLNGLPNWEVRLARELFPDVPLVVSRALMEHDQVLDILFDNLGTDFGILDYDCFVLEPGYFERMRQLSADTLINACFTRINPHSGMKVPETFFLFFNRAAIQSLKARHGVTCRPVRWQELSGECHTALTTLGLGPDCLPEAHKEYFDTLRVLMMLGLTEGLKVNFLAEFPATPTPSGELFHVGGISTPNLIDGLWRFRGAYFWRAVLEQCPLPELKARYQAIYGDQSAEDLKATHPQWSREVSDEFFNFCQRLIA